MIEARRALLASPLLPASDPAFGAVRANAERLRAEFQRELGYELVVRASHARLRKRSDALRTDRPARIPRAGHPDTWQPFTRRHYVLFSLALAACERARVQTSIGLLAEEVRSLAAEESIALDLDSLDDRRCLADVFLYLSTLGVLVTVAGQAESWVRSRAEGDDELLYDVMHSVLDDLIVARPRVVGAADATDLSYGGAYPATEEGKNLERRHRVSRRLVEDPVVYAFELDDRAELARGPALAEWLGLEAERRRRGHGADRRRARAALGRPLSRRPALDAPGRAAAGRTHLPAPRVRGGQPRMSSEDLVDDCRTLRERWGEALCGETPEEMAARGVEILEAMRLVRREGSDVLPLRRDRALQPRRHDRRAAAPGGRMTARFQFMRCGLISLFHYANQVFDAEDGHLLLRGSNGSGKSTAVELVVPLLFDGNLTSSNLSTSDGQRSIVYHLLLDGLYSRRLGYSWAQFARRDEDGAERW